MRVAVPANVQRTIWSPKWSSTRDHGPALTGTDRHAPSNFPLQVNTIDHQEMAVLHCSNHFVEIGELGGLVFVNLGAFDASDAEMDGQLEITKFLPR